MKFSTPTTTEAATGPNPVHRGRAPGPACRSRLSEGHVLARYRSDACLYAAKRCGKGRHRAGCRSALPERVAQRAGRLPHDRCGGRRNLRGQGTQPEGPRHQLCTGRQSLQSHHAHDCQHGRHGVRQRPHRGGSAAAGSQSDQALSSPLQRAAARRQVVSLHPPCKRPSGTADPQASRGAQPQRRVFRAVRIRRRRQSHHQHAGARLPAAVVLGCRIRKPHAAVPALPDQAMLGRPAPGRSAWRTMAVWSRRRCASCAARARTCARCISA